MPFQPIVLTLFNDTLVLPEQGQLHDGHGGKVQPPIVIPADLENLELGAYPFVEMVPASEGLIGGDLHATRVTLFGVHDVCGGKFVFHRISPTHHAILCRICILRIPIPSEIRTYGKLREYADNELTVDPLARFQVRC